MKIQQDNKHTKIDEIFKQIVYQRRNTNGKPAHAKTANIILH
jgi:hypothetical protein